MEHELELKMYGQKSKPAQAVPVLHSSGNITKLS